MYLGNGYYYWFIPTQGCVIYFEEGYVIFFEESSNLPY